MPCVICPKDQLIYVDRRKGCARVSLPPLKYCSSLTRLPGRVHVAVQVGPKLGSQVKQGHYLMKLHILKGGLKIQSCDFKLHVQEPPCTSARVNAPKHGVAECTNGTKNSFCSFTCFPGYYLIGSSKIVCSNGKWYGKRPKCKELKNVPMERPHCLPLKDPENGAISCNNGSARLYPGTTCRIFCDDGYEVSGKSTIMCTGTKWNITQPVECISIQCSAPPDGPGKWKCSNAEKPSGRGDTGPSETNYPKGTTCSYYCDTDYTVATPFLNTTVIRCLAPQWNSSTIPKCHKMIPPKLHCQDEEIVTPSGYAEIQLPKTLAANGNTLPIHCKLSGQLQAGMYHNFCHVTDPFLRTTSNCTYSIYIKTPECNVPNKTKNGRIKCLSPTGSGFPVQTLCQYFCNDGYVIPTSYLGQSVLKCLSSLEWNSTIAPPCQLRVEPKPAEGMCQDIIIEVDETERLQTPIPKFLTSNGSEALVRCSLTQLSNEGQHENHCRALDPELRIEATCKYHVQVITLEKTGEISSQKCAPLSAPENGHITCATRTPKILCQVECREGYMFPPNLTLLHQGEISCDPSIGEWDFQTKHQIKDIPDCLRELSTTSLQLPLRLNVSVKNCENVENLSETMKSIREGLLSRMRKTCETINCLDFGHKCLGQGSSSVLQTIWKLQVSFNPDDYEDVDDVPEAETALEEAQIEAQNIFSSDSTFLKDVNKTGAELQSFQRGLFTLVCQESGFSADPVSYKCYECPAGTYENDGNCDKCQADYFQKITGQTKCLPCPKGTRSTPDAIGCANIGI